MRQKRAKQYKRVMATYVSTFGFREPYQVLVADDFLLEAGKQKDVDCIKLLGTTVQGAIKPMITQCCIEALYALGKEYQNVVNLAKKCERRRCNHRTAIEPQECLKDVIGETNKHRYVLAVQSQKFATTLSTIPGLPIVHYNSSAVMVLAPISIATTRAKNSLEEERRVEGAKVLDGVVDGANVLGSGEPAEPIKRARKPKAPNPLSVKKKKTEQPQPSKKRKVEEETKEHEEKEEEQDREEDGEDQASGRRKKKRKRGRGKGAVAAAIAEIKAGGLGGVINEDIGEAVSGDSGDESD